MELPRESPPQIYSADSNLITEIASGEIPDYYSKFPINGYLRDASRIKRPIDFKKCRYVGYIPVRIMFYWEQYAESAISFIYITSVKSKNDTSL